MGNFEQNKNQAEKNLESISKEIAYLLRHCKGFFDHHGWATTNSVVQAIKKDYPGFNKAYLKEIVLTDEKGRYSYDKYEMRIRANQGHSIPVDLELEPVEPPAFLYHGTASQFVPSILKEGVKKQSRIYVHLSSTTELASRVGSRHGKPVILKINTGKMYRDGYSFFLSVNKVWLTEYVPAEYIEPVYSPDAC